MFFKTIKSIIQIFLKIKKNNLKKKIKNQEKDLEKIKLLKFLNSILSFELSDS